MFAALGIAFTSCVKEEAINHETSETIIATAIAYTPSQDGTRVSIGKKEGDIYPVSWNADDKLKIYEYVNGSFNSANTKTDVAIEVDESDASKATFTFSLTAKSGSSYVYRAVYPSSKSTNCYDNQQGTDAVITLDNKQTPTLESVDPNAAILFADAEAVTKQGEGISFAFEHVVGYAKMTVKGPKAAANEKVQSVKLSSDKNLAGNFQYYWKEEGAAKYVVTSGATNITANLSELDIDADSEFTVWFASLPAELDKFSVEINTDANTYTKECSGTVAFKQGRISSFTVNMTETDVDEPSDELTAEISTFTAVSGDIDGIISYASAQGGGTTAPIVPSGKTFIRLYQKNGGGEGGYITITAKSGYKIKSATIRSNQATSIKYGVDGADERYPSTAASLNANETYTVNDLTASSISFYCYGSSSNNRLEVNYLSVTYVKDGDDVPSTPELTVTSDETIEVSADGDIYEVTYTIANPAEGASVTAKTSGEEWFEVEDVDNTGLTLYVYENETTSPRTGTITLSYPGAESKVITINQAAAGNEDVEKSVELVLDFANMSSQASANISSYTSSWSMTTKDGTWNIQNANNNNKGWAYVKIGAKEDTNNTGSISTGWAVDAAITTVTTNVKKLVSSATTTVTLIVATDSGFNNKVGSYSAQTITTTEGDITFNIDAPQKGCYYKLEYFSNNSTKTNGSIQVNSVKLNN